MFTPKGGAAPDHSSEAETCCIVDVRKPRKPTAAERAFVKQLAELAKKAGAKKHRALSLFKTDTVHYQCELVEDRVDRIVNNFLAQAVNPIILSERADGSLYVLNGQHTAEALRRRGEKTAESIVFEGLTIEQEAIVFLVLNDRGTHVAPSEAKGFKAQVTSGNPVAVAIDKVLKKVGIKLSARGPNGFASVPILRACFAYDNKGAVLETAFWIVKGAWPGIKIDGTMLFSIAGIVAGSKGQYNEGRLRAILGSKSPREWTNIVAENIDGGVQVSRHMPRYYAKTFLDAYNTNIRKHNGPAVPMAIVNDVEFFVQLPQRRTKAG